MNEEKEFCYRCGKDMIDEVIISGGQQGSNGRVKCVECLDKEKTIFDGVR